MGDSTPGWWRPNVCDAGLPSPRRWADISRRGLCRSPSSVAHPSLAWQYVWADWFSSVLRSLFSCESGVFLLRDSPWWLFGFWLSGSPLVFGWWLFADALHGAAASMAVWLFSCWPACIPKICKAPTCLTSYFLTFRCLLSRCHHFELNHNGLKVQSLIVYRW